MADSSQTEALKFVGDWSKWLVVIQTGSIAFIAPLLKADSKSCAVPSHAAKEAFIVGLVSFVLATIAAGALQSSLPKIVVDIQPNENIWDEDIYFLNRSFGKFWAAAELQFGLFVLEAVAFAVSVVLLLG